MPPEINDAELAGLSQEERDALAADADEIDALKGAKDEIDAAAGGEAGGDDDDDTPSAQDAAAEAAEKAAADKAASEKAAAEAAAAADDEDKQAAAKAAADAAAASEKAAADAKKAADDAKAAADKKAADNAAAAAAKAEDDEPFVSTYQAPAVEDFDGKIAALKTAQDSAVENFKAGDLDIDAFNKERDRIEGEREALRTAKVKAEIASETQVQSAEQRWTWEVGRFIRRVARDESIDYGKPMLNAALDSQVKILAADPANKDKDSSWFLKEAHRVVKAELGLGKPGAKEPGAEDAKAAAEKKKREAEAAAAAARRPDRKGLPKGLSGVPAAGVDSAGEEGEFASLDKLSGIELESALARLPKEQADRYLMGQ